MRHAILAVALLAILADIEAQSPSSTTTTETPATFDVASVKPSTGRNGWSFGWRPGNRFHATNTSLYDIIQFAYGVMDDQLAGGPGWIRVDRFDVEAKAERELTLPQLQSALQALLAERFKLVARIEMQEHQVYALVLARADGRLGAGLRPSDSTCGSGTDGRPRSLNDVLSDIAKRAVPEPKPGGRPACGSSGGEGVFLAGGVPVSMLTVRLSRIFKATVVNRTGLTGSFDIDLTWAPDSEPGALANGTGVDATVPSNLPSIFTALEEQLGLELQPERGTRKVIVIERAEKPEPN